MHAKTVILFLSMLAVQLPLNRCNTTPIYLYMRMMTDRLQMTDMSFADSEVLASALDVTSIKGLNSDGDFVLSKGNTLRMTTSCANLLSKPYKPVYSYLLWLFPKAAEDAAVMEGVLNVRFTVSVTSDTAEVTKRRSINAVWNAANNNSCMLLDVTSVMKKYSIKGDNMEDSTAECTIAITVGDIAPEVIPPASQQSHNHGESLCSAFIEKSCSTPFLFLTYFDDQSPPPQATSNGGRQPAAVSRRSVDPYPKNGSCSRKEFNVNLTELISDIVYPVTVDIGVCQGTCTLDLPLIRYYVFKHFSGSAVNHTPCCSVDTLDYLALLVKTEDGYVIEMSLDTIVQSCKCSI